MEDFRPADHAMGLELQLEELTEQRERARVQGRDGDVAAIESEMEQLRAELAATAEVLATSGAEPPPEPELHDADKLSAEA